MSQKITAKRKKISRIKRNKRRRDKFNKWLTDNPDSFLVEYKRRVEESKQLAIKEGIWDEDWVYTFCQPITDWSDNEDIKK